MSVELKPPPRRRIERALEALFREARMLERRRRHRRALLALAACALAASVAYLVVGTIDGLAPAHRGQHPSAFNGGAGAYVVPKDPDSVAVGPNGALFVGDPGRHEVLMRLPNGTFRIAAGTGVAGVSGDGGSALRAEIDVPQSLLMTRSGALLVFDGRDTPSTASGFTAEVREVGRDGKISTLIGACSGVDASPGAVAHAAIGASGAIGPDGDLYVLGQACGAGASGPVLKLTPSGHLVDVPFDAVLRKSCLSPSGIAFSGSGALYAACDSGAGHGKELLIVEPHGSTKTFAGAYPYDDEAGLAVAPDGTIIAVDYFKIVRVTPRGLRTIINLGDGTVYLGRHGSLVPNGRNASMEPNGIAIDRQDNIYLVSTSGSGNGTFTGVIEVHTNGHVQLLWSRPSR